MEHTDLHTKPAIRANFKGYVTILDIVRGRLRDVFFLERANQLIVRYEIEANVPVIIAIFPAWNNLRFSRRRAYQWTFLIPSSTTALVPSLQTPRRWILVCSCLSNVMVLIENGEPQPCCKSQTSRDNEEVNSIAEFLISTMIPPHLFRESNSCRFT